jgi:hypothetical protein
MQMIIWLPLFNYHDSKFPQWPYDAKLHGPMLPDLYSNQVSPKYYHQQEDYENSKKWYCKRNHLSNSARQPGRIRRTALCYIVVDINDRLQVKQGQTSHSSQNRILGITSQIILTIYPIPFLLPRNSDNNIPISRKSAIINLKIILVYKSVSPHSNHNRPFPVPFRPKVNFRGWLKITWKKVEVV